MTAHDDELFAYSSCGARSARARACWPGARRAFQSGGQNPRRNVWRSGSQSSPSTRSTAGRWSARETAWPLAASAGLELQVAAEFDEIDFGEWMGASFDALSTDPRWNRWNALRSATRPPGGEQMLEVQARLVRKLRELHESAPDGCIAVLSQGNVIKCLPAHYAGISLDHFHRIEIGPASITMITLSGEEPRILLVNETGS